MSPTTDTTLYGVSKIESSYTAYTDRISEAEKEIKKHDEALKTASETALKQSDLLKKHDSLIKADRINIQNLTDSVHIVIKESTERFIETDSRMEQLEKENKILKYAVGASALFDFALLFIFMIVTSGY